MKGKRQFNCSRRLEKMPAYFRPGRPNPANVIRCLHKHMFFVKGTKNCLNLRQFFFQTIMHSIFIFSSIALFLVEELSRVQKVSLKFFNLFLFCPTNSILLHLPGPLSRRRRRGRRRPQRGLQQQQRLYDPPPQHPPQLRGHHHRPRLLPRPLRLQLPAAPLRASSPSPIQAAPPPAPPLQIIGRKLEGEEKMSPPPSSIYCRTAKGVP